MFLKKLKMNLNKFIGNRLVIKALSDIHDYRIYFF